MAPTRIKLAGYVKVRMATTYIPFMRPVDGVRWTPSVGQDWSSQ